VRRLLPLLPLLAACGSSGHPSSVGGGRVIEIDIDDHGLAGLWAANAPNLKGLIQRGTLAFSRVIVPTHSNQNNMSLLTGQYPDGTNVPANAWLSRDLGFAPPVALPGLAAGDYLFYDKNPLRVRGDSLYKVAARAGARTAYFGELPPFEGTADDVHLTIVGTSLGTLTATSDLARQLLTDGLHYPKSVVGGYHFDGPPEGGEDVVHFTIRQAAESVRAAPSADAVPRFMFVWDFLALDDDPTSQSGASGPGVVADVEQYDAAIGELLAALDAKGILADTNILFTLDHGKVDTHQQVVLGTHGQTSARQADGQLGAAVTAMSPALGITTADYAVMNEDGDAQIYAVVPGAGTPAGARRQQAVTTALLAIIQSGTIRGLDVTRTMTADGAMGTRRFHDARGSGPNQADILVFPEDDWTLNQVDANNAVPGPFIEHAQFPYGRHGGFSVDELYVPVIMAGPAFKQGVLLPHPVEHPDVAATAAWALGGARLETAARGPIAAALAGDPGETVPLPEPLSSSRALALDAAGFGGRFALAGPPATAAVIIDVAGLYDDEVFDDPALADAAAPLRELAASGTRFESTWARSRDWPVNEYQMLTGGYPIAQSWIAMADDDPKQIVLPAAGLLAMPPPAGRVADRAAYDAWRKEQPFLEMTTPGSLFGSAGISKLTTALVGHPDFHSLHLPAGEIPAVTTTADAGAADAVRAQLTSAPRSLIVVALGGPRTADRRSTRAVAELRALAAEVRDIASAAGDALVVVTSRGATTIDDPGSDFYGAGTSRHVPLVFVGPNVRAGIVSSQPATPADLPATVLYALGSDATVDFADGTRAVSLTPEVTPSSAFEGRVLLRAFSAQRVHPPLESYPSRGASPYGVSSSSVDAAGVWPSPPGTTSVASMSSSPAAGAPPGVWPVLPM
jgi:arylsulfatase A-like enzyme